MPRPLVLALLLPLAAAGCRAAERHAPIAASAVDPGSGRSTNRSPTSSQSALERYDLAKTAMEAKRFGLALELLDEARRLDPSIVEIPELHEKIMRLRLNESRQRASGLRNDWGTSIQVQLAQLRVELSQQMQEISTLLERGEWPEAEKKLELAAARAARVPQLAAEATQGRVMTEWRERGTRAMSNGDFDAASIAFEFAFEGWAGETDSAGRLSRQVTRLQAESCRFLGDEPRPDPASASQDRQAHSTSLRKSFPRSQRFAFEPASHATRHRVAELVRSVARARIFSMERGEAESDLDLALWIEPDAAATLRLRSALRSLQDWEPLCASDEWNARVQRAVSSVLRLDRMARRAEGCGDFEAAAYLHDEIAIQLRWMPYEPQLEERSQQAKVSAARCRRQAQAALR
ncbi:MAG: hypothetical protein AAB074_03835 [Planctomycetota bacterium]